MPGRKTERHVLRRGPAAPAGAARIDDEKRIAAVENDVFRLCGESIEDFALEKRSVDALVFELEVTPPFAHLAVSRVDEVEIDRFPSPLRGCHHVSQASHGRSNFFAGGRARRFGELRVQPKRSSIEGL